MIAALLLAAAAQAAPVADSAEIGRALRGRPARECAASAEPGAVVVCGRSPDRFRIDPAVLEAQRAAEAPRAKPETRIASANTDCVGPQHCGGGTVPLVGMALAAAAKAAILAIDGEDWREPFRTRPDGYQAYQRARAKPKIGISLGAGVTK